MKISVVMVSLNAAATIGRSIDSFLAQTHAAKELIVVDGASTDGTRQMIDSFGDRDVVVISEADGGIYHAMNKGLAAFTGDAVGFLNADDRFSDGGALAAIADGLAEADIVFGNLDFVRDHGKRDVVRRWRVSPYQKGAFRRGWMPPHPTFYCRRHVVDAVGRFDLRYRIAADYDFMLRALEVANFTTRATDRVLVDMLYGGRSTAGLRSRLRHNLEALASRRQWLGAGLVDYALLAKPLRKVPQFLGG